jgi:PAS domain S-box-containing protein
MHESEIRSLLIEQAPDAVIYADRHGIIREWNSSAFRIFGFTAEEALGKSLDIIVPERFREAHWRGYEKALSEGRTKYSGQALPTRSARKDGSTIYVELTFAVVHDRNASVVGAVAHARDISERWEREREQRRKVQELEQKLEDARSASDG